MIDFNNVIVVIFLIALFECIGQGMLKHYNNNNHICFFLIGISCYILVCFFLLKCYKLKNMGAIVSIWSGISIILMVSIGTLLFNEKLLIKDIFGIILIMIGIYLIQYDGNHLE